MHGRRDLESDEEARFRNRVAKVVKHKPVEPKAE
jgi:hypothetical protein